MYQGLKLQVILDQEKPVSIPRYGYCADSDDNVLSVLGVSILGEHKAVEVKLQLSIRVKKKVSQDHGFSFPCSRLKNKGWMLGIFKDRIAGILHGLWIIMRFCRCQEEKQGYCYSLITSTGWIPYQEFLKKPLIFSFLSTSRDFYQHSLS